MRSFIISASTVLLAAPVVGVAILLGAGGATSDASAVAMCATSGPVHGLDATQARNARTIVAAAQQTGVAVSQAPEAQARAELIALMTAATESTIHNYANPQVPASTLLPNDGPPASGGDHDSVGMFQQRESWGPLASRMNPIESTRLFVKRLFTVPAWQTLAPGVAAQTVQQSSYPDRYATKQPSAQAWLQQITTGSRATTCGGDDLPPTSTGTFKPGTIPIGYTLPAIASDAERRAITFALAQVGKKYVFGAAGPEAFDCSGLTMAAWAAAGVQLPHYTIAQYQTGIPVADSSLLAPGDLIFIPGSDGTLDPPNPQHVGIYIGEGYVVEAPQTGDVIKIVAADGFKPVIGIRHIA
jgi:cell wall-associated NlpC family hydrolase